MELMLNHLSYTMFILKMAKKNFELTTYEAGIWGRVNHLTYMLEFGFPLIIHKVHTKNGKKIKNLTTKKAFPLIGLST